MAETANLAPEGSLLQQVHALVDRTPGNLGKCVLIHLLRGVVRIATNPFLCTAGNSFVQTVTRQELLAGTCNYLVDTDCTKKYFAMEPYLGDTHFALTVLIDMGRGGSRGARPSWVGC